MSQFYCKVFLAQKVKKFVTPGVIRAMPYKRYILQVVCILFLVGVLHGPAIVSAVLVNIGMLDFCTDLVSEESSPSGNYRFYAVFEDDSNIESVMSAFRRAVLVDDDNNYAKWALGRAALASAQFDVAADAMRDLEKEAKFQPLLYQDSLIAFSFSDEPEEVIALYEAAPSLKLTQVFSDIVTLAYLDRSTEVTNSERKLVLLEQALDIREGDPYANYFLFQTARDRGNITASVSYSETLTHFPLQAIDPADERLLEYTAQVIPSLLKDGLWDRAKVVNVISFLTWQHTEAAGTVHLLERLMEDYPLESDWPFYLGELYYRRGDLKQAEMTYQQALAVDAAYAQTYLRLGMIAEEGGRQGSVEIKRDAFVQAADWYSRYYTLAPNDLLGLECLTEVCSVLADDPFLAMDGNDESCINMAERLADMEGYDLRSAVHYLQDTLIAHTDSRWVVSQMLTVPVESVVVGPNLVTDGEFEDWIASDPVGWQWAPYLGRSGSEGLYAAGEDTLAPGGQAGRIATLWGGMLLEGTMTYGEYIGDALQVNSGQYLVTIQYRVQPFTEGSALVFLGEYSPNGRVLLTASLESVVEGGHTAHFLVDNSAGPIAIRPVIRVWGNGQLWIQSFEISPLGFLRIHS